MNYLTVFYLSGITLGVFTTVESTIPKTYTPAREEDYDEKLSNFLREILENFRDVMPYGIPDIGVPPIDPLTIRELDEDIDNDIAKMILKLRDVNITGISKFKLNYIKADLEKGFANLSISIPKLMADGYCYLDGKVLGIFPLTSDGPFQINVSEVNIDGHGELNLTNGKQTRLHMNDMKLNLTFGPLDIGLENLLGGAKWTKTFSKMLTKIGRNLFIHFHEEAMTKLSQCLLTVINEELDKGTFAELIDQIELAEPEFPENEFSGSKQTHLRIS